MALLRIRVKCFHCNKEVSEAEALPVKSVTNKTRYNCYLCYQKHKTHPWGFGDKIPVKKELYCERCRYKFISKKEICPYCNKEDLVMGANVTVKDLL